MMGSGKTTVGKILSQAINYSFIDRFVVRLLLSLVIVKKVACSILISMRGRTKFFLYHFSRYFQVQSEALMVRNKLSSCMEDSQKLCQ